VSFLLDTNVISEWVKPQPNPNVVSWLARLGAVEPEDRVFLSVVSFAEIRRGIELMERGRRRERLARWLADDLSDRFKYRILGIGQHIAETWGIVMGRAQKAGATLGAMDAFIAATAEAHRLTLVTRNTRDFAIVGIPLLNPWDRKS